MPAPLGPVYTAHLLPAVEEKLLELLRSLTAEDWERQTLAPKWKVKDVAAHLLDTQLRKLSICRDGAWPAGGPAPGEDLAAFINRLNDEGVRVYRRLSPALLISLMEQASRESAAYHQSLDPHARATFAVSWAGESESQNWFDTARELTERWHHQQQIRVAVNRPGIMTRELYFPVLDCFMRALPHAYRTVDAPEGTCIRFHVAGDCGGDWFLERGAGAWRLLQVAPGAFVAETTIPQEIAWRIFTKGIDRKAARREVTVRGDENLGLHILSMIAIVG